MGLKDSSAKIFFADPKQAAELVNLCFFKGEHVFNESDLHELSPDQYKLKRDGRGELIEENRHRDLIFLSDRLTDGTPGKMLIGIEFQSSFESDMIIRMDEYDARQYLKQYKSLVKKNMGHLIPVAGIVVNLSMGRWGGAKSLYQMLNLKTGLPGVNESKMNLVDLYDIDDDILQKCNDELYSVLKCFKNHNNADILEKLIREYEDKGIISAAAGDVLETHLDIKLTREINTEDKNMCKGWDDLTARLEKKGILKGELGGQMVWRKIGNLEGKIEGLQEGMEKGRQEGMQKGMEKGMQKGMEKGMQEGGNNAFATVITNAIKNNLGLETVKQITGFTYEQLQQFTAENGIDFPF